MRLFYFEKPVKVVREYFFQKVLKAEILIEGETMYVDRSVLTEIPRDREKSTEPFVDEVENTADGESEAPKEVDKTLILQTEKSDQQHVYAIKIANNKETLIGAINSNEFKEFIQKNKLNEESVIAVIEKKQKTHKGFKFIVK